MMRSPVGCVAIGSSLVVVCDDGSAWVWAPKPPGPSDDEQRDYAIAEMKSFRNWPHDWRAYHSPIPGSAEARHRETAKDPKGAP